jgi:hypothetical protein
MEDIRNNTVSPVRPCRRDENEEMWMRYVNSYDLGGKNRHGGQIKVLMGRLSIDLLPATTISHPSLELQVQRTCPPTRTQVGYCKSVRFQIHQLVRFLLPSFSSSSSCTFSVYFLRKSELDKSKNAKALRIGTIPI